MITTIAKAVKHSVRINPVGSSVAQVREKSCGGCSSCGPTKSLSNFPTDIEDLMKLMPSKKGLQNMGHKANFRPNIVQRDLRKEWLRGGRTHGSELEKNWKKTPATYSENEAFKEASRCIKCVDAPCQKGCPTAIDIRSFIQSMTNRNWYGAAKTIFSDNPLALSCGSLCSVESLCASTCTLGEDIYGPIQIGRLQEFACSVFMKSGVPQMRDPSIKENYDEKIALIGCGPASMSAATYMARLGYNNVHIIEKENIGGGLVATEIPAQRQPWEYTKWEVDQLKNLGVEILYNTPFKGDFEELKRKGYKAIFLGNGFQSPKLEPTINSENVEDSKTFLRRICWGTKPEMEPLKNVQLPKLSGHVLVLGFGDSALDCVNAAFRCGAERVTCAFRRGMSDKRATESAFFRGYNELCEFMPFSSPEKVVLSADGKKAERVEFVKFHPNSNDINSTYSANDSEKFSVNCDHVITSFGSANEEEWMKQLIQEAQGGLVDMNTMMVRNQEGLFAGGDIVGGNDSVVGAVNDGKTASWFMHKYLRNLAGEEVSEIPNLPGFFSPIDLVDISTQFGGKQFENPFGLASAPPTTSWPMIRRAFNEGWGYAVVKTFSLDKDTIINVNPRIIKARPLAQDKAGYMNIELISEKSAQYWCEGVAEIKKEFPDRVIIGSIMAGPNQEDWEELTEMVCKAGYDMVELNLSCPHGMGERGMGRACGEDPDLVEKITRWVKNKSSIPVYPKMTPNVGEIEVIANAAKRGGADGVTATNTMPAMMDPTPDGKPNPAVGDSEHTAIGGASGSTIRPFSLRKVSQIKTEVDPNFPVLGSGGIIGADHAMAYFRYGADIVQVCSAVQSHDYSVIQDLVTGVKAHLYMDERGDLKDMGWISQTPPVNFGKQPVKLMSITKSLEVLKQVPSLSSIIGTSLHHLHKIMDMDFQKRLIAQIDPELCINCGKCYSSCADSAYQAITLDEKTHLPSITRDCTGCGLCETVCPVTGAIIMVEREEEFKPNRGIEPKGVDPKFTDGIPGSKKNPDNKSYVKSGGSAIYYGEEVKK